MRPPAPPLPDPAAMLAFRGDENAWLVLGMLLWLLVLVAIAAGCSKDPDAFLPA